MSETRTSGSDLLAISTAEPEAEQLEPAGAASAREPTAKIVSVAELVFLAAGIAVGVVALVSLIAAHLHHHTLATVGVVSAAVLLVVGVLVWWRDRPAMRLDLPGLLPVLAGAALAAGLMFPGFQYATGDRDPGVYVEHAAAIARTHSIDFPDDVLAANLPGGIGPNAQWPGLWTESGQPGKILPQFYHLWPALLATAKDAGGFLGLFDTGPLVGVIAVGLAVSVARRLAGVVAAWGTAAVLSTSMLEVWQAKYPSAEIFGQMLFMTALLAIVLAIRSRWRSVAVVGGVFLSLGYLERPDGVILVVLGWAALCGLFAVRRFDSRAAAFSLGLLALLPYGLVQAYRVAGFYTSANGVPSFPKLMAIMLALALAALLIAARPTAGRRVLAWAGQRRVQLGLGTAFVVLCGGLMLLGGLRPVLFSPDYENVNGTPSRTFDESSLIRLSWFFSLPGLFLLLCGFAFVAWRTWRLDRWLVALPTAGLLALYCWHTRNSPYLMWSTRRFVTTVVPGMAIMIGCGLALGWLLLRRFVTSTLATAAVAVAAAALMVFQLLQSWPLRNHDENGGSLGVERQLAALSGDQRGVYLFSYNKSCCAAPFWLFGGPMLAIYDQSSALISNNSVVTAYVDHYRGTGRPIFYVDTDLTPPNLPPGIAATKVLQLTGALPHWQETFTKRPDGRMDYPYNFAVYRLNTS